MVAHPPIRSVPLFGRPRGGGGLLALPQGEAHLGEMNQLQPPKPGGRTPQQVRHRVSRPSSAGGGDRDGHAVQTSSIHRPISSPKTSAVRGPWSSPTARADVGGVVLPQAQ